MTDSNLIENAIASAVGAVIFASLTSLINKEISSTLIFTIAFFAFMVIGVLWKRNEASN